MYAHLYEYLADLIFSTRFCHAVHMVTGGSSRLTPSKELSAMIKDIQNATKTAVASMGKVEIEVGKGSAETKTLLSIKSVK